ncbi:tetratricopeptide-like helical protein [Diplodia corticola]|uniref:Tetratricopeptide-like helical protein n=1 Tax=Diplodia corticola TaxID=236234 RepID=A0A1J9RWJ7_9PEZI|nr:tetratricopeptide-like helical protein [Diplodia corticola]OJD32212.1 tetratricopeptide-like helical protein [Diplodia corticola]
MSAPDADSATPPFFRLPRELRDEVYASALAPHNFRVEHDDDHVEYKYDLRLMRVNRQLHDEATQVFRRLNVFARIETPWPEAKQHISGEGRVPIVASGPAAASFSAAHLRVNIEAYQYAFGHDETHSLVVLVDHLPHFCRMWYYSDLSHPGLNTHLRLTLALQDPFSPTTADNRIPQALKRRMLAPFGDIKHLHALRIEGQADASLEAELRSAQAVPYKTAEECLEEASRLKDEGNAALQKNQFREALRLYEEAFLAMHIVVSGKRRSIWGNAYFETHLHEGQFADQYGQLVRLVLRVKLVANTTLAYLKLEDYHMTKFWGMRSIQLMRDGMGIENDDDDQPMPGFAAANEMGKIYYRTALACKALDETEQARKLLRIAVQYLPRDPHVQAALASVALRI